MTTPTPAYVTAQNVANLLDVSVMSVYRLVNDGAFPGTIRVGRKIRIPLRAVRTFIGENEIKPGGLGKYAGGAA